MKANPSTTRRGVQADTNQGGHRRSDIMMMTENVANVVRVSAALPMWLEIRNEVNRQI